MDEIHVHKTKKSICAHFAESPCKYRLLHHVTIVNKRCWFDSYCNNNNRLNKIKLKIMHLKKLISYLFQNCYVTYIF